MWSTAAAAAAAEAASFFPHFALAMFVGISLWSLATVHLLPQTSLLLLARTMDSLFACNLDCLLALTSANPLIVCEISDCDVCTGHELSPGQSTQEKNRRKRKKQTSCLLMSQTYNNCYNNHESCGNERTQPPMR